jgi:undecaprenyl-phosphate galactose phosphotransferase
MSSLLILGDKYKFLNEDHQKLQKDFSKIYRLSISINNTPTIIKELDSFIKQNSPCLIILNLEKHINMELEEYLEELDYQGLKFYTFADFSFKFLDKVDIELNEENYRVLIDIKHEKRKQILKRLFDMGFALFALTLLMPIILLITLWIKIKSPHGDIFFTQRRLGLHGKFFRVYKFRTMVPNAEKILEELLANDPILKDEYFTYRKLENDPRIIPHIGHFLRKTSLDELPQFFNVLLGDMSVVGPRPYIYKEFERYTKTHIDIITSIKPGVTGLWQVTERMGTTFQSRIEKDMHYIISQNFWMDINIIFKTVKVMISKEGV